MVQVSYWYVGIIVPAAILIPAFTGLFRFRYLDRPLKVLLVYLSVAAVTNALAAVLAFRNKENLHLLHVYTAVEFFLLSVYFCCLLQRRSVRSIVAGMAVLFCICCLLNMWLWQAREDFNTYTRPFQSIALTSYSLYYLYTGTGRLLSKNGVRAHYLVTAGLILYFGGALIQFAFSNVVSRLAEKQLRLLLWDIHATLVLIMYVMFARAFLVCKR